MSNAPHFIVKSRKRERDRLAALPVFARPFSVDEHDATDHAAHEGLTFAQYLFARALTGSALSTSPVSLLVDRAQRIVSVALNRMAVDRFPDEEPAEEPEDDDGEPNGHDDEDEE